MEKNHDHLSFKKSVWWTANLNLFKSGRPVWLTSTAWFCPVSARWAHGILGRNIHPAHWVIEITGRDVVLARSGRRHVFPASLRYVGLTSFASLRLPGFIAFCSVGLSGFIALGSSGLPGFIVFWSVGLPGFATLGSPGLSGFIACGSVGLSGFGVLWSLGISIVGVVLAPKPQIYHRLRQYLQYEWQYEYS